MKTIFKIISLILESKQSEKIYSKLVMKFINENPKLKALYKGYKTAYGLIMNPENWFKLFKNATTEEVETIVKITRVLEKSTYTKSYYKVDKNKYNKHTEELNKELRGEGDWVHLSSSWINDGKWEMTNRNKVLGAMTITIYNWRHPYTYPFVPYQVWVAMKNAKGTHGSGAGSAFWKFWLHDWLPSNLREKVLRDLRTGHIGEQESIEVFRDQTSRSATNFFRSKSPYVNEGTLSKAWYTSRGGKGYASQQLRDFKKYYYYQSRYITYKNFTKTKTYYDFTPIHKKIKRKVNVNNTTYKAIKKAQSIIKKAMDPYDTIKKEFKKEIKKGAKQNGKKGN